MKPLSIERFSVLKKLRRGLLTRPLLAAALLIVSFCLLVFAIRPSLGETIFGFNHQVLLLQDRLKPSEAYAYRLVRLWRSDGRLHADAKLLLDGKSLPCQLVFPAETLLLTDLSAQASENQNPTGFLEGDLVWASGRFIFPEKPTNPGQFDTYTYYQSQHRFFSVYLQQVSLKQGHAWYDLGALAGRLRHSISQIIDENFSQESAAVLKAMLLGDKGSLTTDQKALFSKAGISHIAAISGMHLTILMAALEELLKNRLRPGSKSLCLQGLLWFYTGLTGFSIATLRAAIMLLYRQMAPLLDADPDDISALSLSAIVILLFRPWAVLSSAFWLTFLAVAGLWAGRLFAMRLTFLPYYFREKISASLGVTIFTAPVVCWFFYEASAGSFFLNLLIVPLAQIILLMGVMGVTLSALLPAAGYGITHVCGGMIHWMIRLSQASSDLPWLSFYGQPKLWQLLFCYLAIVLLICSWSYPRFSRARLGRIGVCLSLLLVTFLPFEDNRVTFLDVGQGDCCVVEWDGKTILVDAGPAYDTVILPFLKYRGIRKLDLLVLSHPDSDHMDGAVSLLEDGMRVDTLLEADAASHETDGRKYLEKLVEQGGGRVVKARARDRFFLEGSSVYMDVLSPVREFGNTNDDSLTMLLRASDALQIVFTGDISSAVDPDLNLERIDESVPVLLKVAHHGSMYSTSEGFLSALSPDLSLMSCGRNNRYGHPHEELLERLSAQHLAYQITAVNGAVWVETDYSSKDFSFRDFSFEELLRGGFVNRTLEYKHMF